MSDAVQVEIKRVGPGDAHVFAHVADGVFDEPVDAQRLADYLAAPDHMMLVALAGDVVVGQCAAVIHWHPDKATELYIDEVGVAPAFHRQGIARRMLDTMFALGRECGCGEAWVGTEHDNVAARALYETRGGTKPESFVMYIYDL